MKSSIPFTLGFLLDNCKLSWFTVKEKNEYLSFDHCCFTHWNDLFNHPIQFFRFLQMKTRATALKKMYSTTNMAGWPGKPSETRYNKDAINCAGDSRASRTRRRRGTAAAVTGAALRRRRGPVGWRTAFPAPLSWRWLSSGWPAPRCPAPRRSRAAPGDVLEATLPRPRQEKCREETQKVNFACTSKTLFLTAIKKYFHEHTFPFGGDLLIIGVGLGRLEPSRWRPLTTPRIWKDVQGFQHWLSCFQFLEKLGTTRYGDWPAGIS